MRLIGGQAPGRGGLFFRRRRSSRSGRRRQALKPPLKRGSGPENRARKTGCSGLFRLLAGTIGPHILADQKALDESAPPVVNYHPGRGIFDSRDRRRRPAAVQSGMRRAKIG